MKKEWKTISIDKGVYNLLKDKQSELIKENNDNYVELGYVAEVAIVSGISYVTLPEEI